MTSKERVLVTLNHKKPDRVPATFKGTLEVDKMVMDHFGLKKVEEIKDLFLVDNLHWPWRNLSPKNLNEPRKEGSVTYDIWGVGKSPVSYGVGSYEEVVFNPLASAKTVDDIKGYNWPKVSDLDFSNIGPECERYKDQALGGCIWTIFERANDLRGFEQFLLDLALNEDLAWALIEKIEEFNWEYNQKMLEVAGEDLTIMATGDDFGSQISTLMSPGMWRKYFLPGMKEAFEFAHRNGMKVVLHSDGAIRSLIPDLIADGLNLLDPVQPQAKGMNLPELFREFGKDLSFHGTIDVQGLLPFGKPEEIYTEVRSQLEKYGQNGGFFLAPSHCIQLGTPLENILAMYEAYKDFGRL